MTQFAIGTHDEDEQPSERQPYDTFAGIHEACQTLEGFNRLCAERHEAAYGRKERLQEWMLFDGAISLDTCGNAGKGMRTPVKGLVFTRKDFWEMVERQLPEEERSMSYGMGGDQCAMPREGMVCPECGQPWTVDNFLEAYVTRTFRAEDLATFGITIGQWERKESTPAESVRLQIHRPGERDIFDKDCVLKKGDDATVSRWAFHHPECLRMKVTMREQQKFDECLAKAGFTCRLFTPVANEYWGYPDTALWFKVQTEFIQLKIGWRKRVVNVNYPEGIGCVTDDSVTKGPCGFHAWSYDKLTEYLTEVYKRCRENNIRDIHMPEKTEKD
jgi:hypothetical protein